MRDFAVTPARVAIDGAAPKMFSLTSEKFLGADRPTGPVDSDLREDSGKNL